MVGDYSERQILSDLAEHYLVAVPRDLGGANVVTGILITFRGFDTLGEVAVLFMVAASVGILLGGTPGPEQPTEERRRPSELVENGSKVILPLIFLFGALRDHERPPFGRRWLSRGRGGCLRRDAHDARAAASRLDHGILSVTESLAGVIYVALGICGLWFAGGFLDSHILPQGEFGTLFSAGAIPVISALLGIKVGAELSVIIDRFRS